MYLNYSKRLYVQRHFTIWFMKQQKDSSLRDFKFKLKTNYYVDTISKVFNGLRNYSIREQSLQS